MSVVIEIDIFSLINKFLSTYHFIQQNPTCRGKFVYDVDNIKQVVLIYLLLNRLKI